MSKEVHCQPHGIRLEVSLTLSEGPLELLLLAFSLTPHPIEITPCQSYLQHTGRIQPLLTTHALI